MVEQIIPKNKRFISIAEYQRKTGLSYASIKANIRNKTIRAVETESGQYRIDTAADGPDLSAVLERLSVQEKLLNELCKHLGIGR